MPNVYRIRDWRKNFEVSQSLRIVGPLAWVGIPTKHDGKSFRRLIRQPNGPALYCCWILIVQIAAKCPVRGVLSDADGPLNADDLSDKTGCPASLLSEALEVLSSKQIRWIEIVDSESISENTPLVSESPPYTVPDPTEPDRTEPDKTDKLPAPVRGAGDLMDSKKSGKLPALDRIRPVHLADDRVLESLRDALAEQHPDKFKKNDNCLLAILAAAERAIEIGKRPVALFVAIVREQQWPILSEQQHARAAQRLRDYRRLQEAAKCQP